MLKLAQVDHRMSPRTAPPEEVSAKLMVGGRSYPTKLANYSISGVAVSVEPDVIREAEAEGFEIEVTLPGNPTYLGKVRHHRIENESALLGIQLEVSDPSEEEISFLSTDPDWDLIEDPETLQNIFSDLLYKGPESLVQYQHFKNRASLISKEIKEGQLVLEVHETFKGEVRVGRGSFRFELFQTYHAFEASVVKVEGQLVYIELPKQIARLLRRETVRISNGDHGVFLKLKLSSQLLGEAPSEIEVLDFSEHGLGFLDKTGWSYAPRGVKIEKIEIETSKGGKIAGSGVICTHRWVPLLEAYSVGIQFETATDHDRNVWHNTILEARYPSLKFDYHEEDHPKIWALFDRSGYLDLQDREAFSHVVDVTKNTWQKLSNAGTKLSKRAMIKREDLVVGHLQLDQIYPNTWCAHHLAIDPKISKTVGKELFSVITDVLSSEGAKYLLSITQASKPWNQRNYYDFVKNYRFPDHNLLQNFQLYEIEMKENWRLEINPSIQLRFANKYDHQRIIKYFEIFSSDLERNANGLNAENLKLENLDSELKPYGMERGREFLVALDGSKMLGFARLETGTKGINIWGLQDLIYVHLMPDLGILKDSVHETLVCASLNRMRDLGKNNVIMMLDDGRQEYYNSKGVKFVWEAVRWIAKCIASRRYHAFSQMLYGHLLLMREEIHKRKRRTEL